MTDRSAILRLADEAVHRGDHGPPEATFRMIAAFWSDYLGVHVAPHDAAAMLALMKIARSKANPGHLDSHVDAAGYMACAGELATTRAVNGDGGAP